MEPGDREALRTARQIAQRLVAQDSKFGYIEAHLVSEGFDAGTIRITMRHIMEDSLAVMERNVRFYRYVGRGLIAVAVATVVFFGVGDLLTRRGMFLHWGSFVTGVLFQVRAYMIARQVAQLRAHRWLAADVGEQRREEPSQA